MSKPWWQDPITQPFNPPVEPGQDIGTPFHTPITDLVPGVVKSMGYGPWGGRIDIMQSGTGGGNIVEYYQHLDEIAPGLNVGSMVTAGQFLGLSGGQLAGGEHPNLPPYSTGPHVEVGVVSSAGAPQDPSQLIAAGPAGIGSGPSSPTNPLSQFLAGFTAGAGLGVAPGSSSAGGGGGLVNVSVPDPIASLRDWFGSGVNQLKGQVAGGPGFFTSSIIPLVVAVAIILVVLGSGDKSQQPAQPQIIPVPV